MSTATFEVQIPTELLSYGFHPDDIQNQVTEWLVLSLFKDSRVSSGKAARLLGLTRIEFLALLRRRGIAYIDFSPAELAEEFAAAKSLPARTRP